MNIKVTKQNKHKNEIVKYPSTNGKIKTYKYYFFSDSGRDARSV